MGWRFVCEQPVDRSSGDVVSRRRLVTGMATGLATAAAFGGVATEASAQTAREGAAPSHLRFLNPPTSPKNPAYTQAIEATVPARILYLSGQQGLDVDDKLAGSPGDFRAQAEQAFLNIKGALAAAGAAWSMSSSSTTTSSTFARISKFCAISVPRISIRPANRRAPWCRSAS
jgi:enamine deaminase RidA (YjgF/YER057c/UK114 family)